MPGGQSCEAIRSPDDVRIRLLAGISVLGAMQRLSRKFPDKMTQLLHLSGMSSSTSVNRARQVRQDLTNQSTVAGQP